MEIKYKQFVIVPKRPKMSPGKIASQVAHATFLALEQQKEIVGKVVHVAQDFSLSKIIDIEIESGGDIIEKWQKSGMCVIVLQVHTAECLNYLHQYLDKWNIPNELYIDEGLTEVCPFTPTALATGILTEDKFWIFENLELYK